MLTIEDLKLIEKIQMDFKEVPEEYIIKIIASLRMRWYLKSNQPTPWTWQLTDY